MCSEKIYGATIIKKCPKCNIKMKAIDLSVGWQCPNCRKIYNEEKASKQIEIFSLITKKKWSRIKRSEMIPGVIYIVCPDNNCKLFFDKLHQYCNTSSCPRQKETKFFIICKGCNEMIELPGNHCSWQGIDHKCSDGRIYSDRYTRMNGIYHLLHEMPENE